MKNRSVVKLLACLGQRNINSLDSYLHSFYSNQECVVLFDAMKECAPKFSSKKMRVEQVWQRSFPNKKLSTSRLDKLCSYLAGHVKEFMAWQEMREDAITREKLFFKAVKKYEMREEVEETLEGLVPLIKEKKNTEIWTNEALIGVYHHLYFSTNLMRKKDKGKQALIDILENLDAFYLTYRTLLETEKKSRSYIVKEEFLGFNFEEIRGLLRTTLTKNKTSILFQTLESFLGELVKNDASFYNILEERVFSLLPELHISDQETILNFLTIVANYYAKQGRNEFTPKIFRIFKYGIESGSSIKNNSISHMFFSNLVDVACKSNEIDWADNFCQNYQRYLSKETQTETIDLSMGRIAFARKDYKKAKKLLEGRKFSDQNNMRGRWLLTMVYFDSEDDKLLNECEAFTQYLYRDKLSNDMNIKGTHNFLKVIGMLKNPNLSKEDIIVFINDRKVISQRIWLDEKIRERRF